MDLYERISYLSKKQGLSVFDLAEKLGLSRNAIYSWKKSSPKADTLEKVANYFNVSIDYLVGREEKNNTSIASDDLDKILDNAKSFDGKPITENDKEAIRLFLEGRMSK
ncbi:helix-turn-helix domain-containing protein [Enterococcus thailandicus]